MAQHSSSPRHVAIIMDGNRRWAKQHKLQVLQGHDYVANKVIEPLVDHCLEKGISYLTLWAFSTENWKRDKMEVEGLLQIFRNGLQRNGEMLHRKGVRLRAIGDWQKFPEDIRHGIEKWLDETKQNQKMTVTLALNYGGRDEILRAVKKMSEVFQTQEEFLEHLSEAEFGKYLDTAEMPDPDLIIRPGGEQRLSGYLAWQAIYAELYFTEVLMPDFTPAEFDKALEEYARRERRFGG